MLMIDTRSPYLELYTAIMVCKHLFHHREYFSLRVVSEVPSSPTRVEVSSILISELHTALPSRYPVLSWPRLSSRLSGKAEEDGLPVVETESLRVRRSESQRRRLLQTTHSEVTCPVTTPGEWAIRYYGRDQVNGQRVVSKAWSPPVRGSPYYSLAPSRPSRGTVTKRDPPRQGQYAKRGVISPHTRTTPLEYQYVYGKVNYSYWSSDMRTSRLTPLLSQRYLKVPYSENIPSLPASP